MHRWSTAGWIAVAAGSVFPTVIVGLVLPIVEAFAVLLLFAAAQGYEYLSVFFLIVEDIRHSLLFHARRSPWS
jgi:hypothetical protein